jgi:hypothetical protein
MSILKMGQVVQERSEAEALYDHLAADESLHRPKNLLKGAQHNALTHTLHILIDVRFER